MITRKALKVTAPTNGNGHRNGDGTGAPSAKGIGASKATKAAPAAEHAPAPDAMARVRVTFALPDEGIPVSVVGDFNGWDPMAHPLRRRSNGTRSVAVDLEAGRSYAFRYLAEGGHFWDDPAADGHEANGYGGTHSVLSC